MQFNAALFSIVLAGTAAAAPLQLEARNLPTLDNTQNAHAEAIVGEIRRHALGPHACATVFATALQESLLYVYANPAVPASLNYPHDKVGGDQDSVGIFQQRPEWYPNIATDMDPAGSAGLFLDQMVQISGWQNIPPGTLAQDVQKSEFPDAYNKWVPTAQQICSAAGF